MNTKFTFILISLVTVCCLILFQYHDVFDSESLYLLPPTNKSKIILYYTPMFHRVDWYYGLGNEPFKNCAFKNCNTTHDKNVLPIDEFDALLFHGHEYSQMKFGKPEKRSPRQIYIFGNIESPDLTPSSIEKENDFYNWTMTYRLDSDLVRTYGYINRSSTSYQLPSIEEIQKRPKKIAWLVSNCQSTSRRDLLYSEMNKYAPIDAYGRCYKLKCPKDRDKECYDMIEKQYKFYLSFENALCEDYVTEKVYNILQRNLVPIVYGGANYSAFLPPNSVINVMDFKSVPELINYINYLDNNPTEYLKYFEWKKHGASVRKTNVMCDLCKKLNEPITTKTYTNIYGWWFGEDRKKCDNDFIKTFL